MGPKEDKSQTNEPNIGREEKYRERERIERMGGLWLGQWVHCKYLLELCNLGANINVDAYLSGPLNDNAAILPRAYFSQ